MIKWKILNVEYIDNKDGLNKVVNRVFWVAEKSDPFGYGNSYGYHTLDVDNINAESFVEFDNLTEEEVTKWLHEQMGSHMVEEIENTVLRRRQNNHLTGGIGKPRNW